MRTAEELINQERLVEETKKKMREERKREIKEKINKATTKLESKIKTLKKLSPSSKALKKRLKKPRRVLRRGAPLAVNLGPSNYRAPSVLGDENRFFTGSYEQEKRSMFFS